MIIKRTSKEEYENYVKNYTTVFETPDFNELNSLKCKEIHYLLFVDKKYRWGLIGGLKEDRIFKVPFSAPYSMFTSVKQNNKIQHYDNAVKALIEYCKNTNIKGIYFTLPPKFYNETHISNIENTLFNNGFIVDKVDLNFYYKLDDYTKNYLNECNIKARQKINVAIKSGLSFERVENTDDIKQVYNIIKLNRKHKGYPLHLSYEDIVETVKVIDTDFFLINDNKQNPIASAIIFKVSNDTVQVIYWGNKPNSDNLCPMNYLAYCCYKYYSQTSFKYFDIGPSTDNSVPNFGLCDFKQTIGCYTNSKYSYMLRLV